MKNFTKSLALFLMLCFVATNFVTAQHILCVDRDGSFENPDIFTDDWQFLQPALDELANGYDYFEVQDLTLDGPDEATMANYPIVLWFTGEAWSGGVTMTDNDEFNLMLYLMLHNGSLLLSAQDYLYDRYPDAGTFSSGSFPHDILGLNEVAQDVWNIEPDTGNIIGSVGSAAEGMAFTVKDIYTEETDDGLYIDEIISHQGEDLLEVVFPEPEGIGAYQYDDGSFRVIFSTISFAAVYDLEDRTELLNNSINWLLGVTKVAKITMEQTEMVVFPNPAAASVQIGCKDKINEMWIINSTGQVVDHFIVGDSKTKVNTSSYPAGLYLVKVKTENGIATEQLVVQ